MLGELRVASPCSADWDQMVGDDRVRFCGQCNLNVFNFSAMTTAQVEELVATHQGRLCGRFYRRTDDTVLTQDCPVGFRARVKRVSRVAGGLLYAVFSALPATAQVPSGAGPIIQVDQVQSGVIVHVIDQTGADLNGARIELLDSSGKTLASGVASEQGQLRIQVHSGKYRMQVVVPGFSTYTREVEIPKFRMITENVTLRIGALMGEVVEVKPGPVSRFFSSLGHKLGI